MRLKALTLSFGEQLFKACGDESRIRIMHLLHKNGKLCISDIEHILDFTQTKTSRHVSYLKNSGILTYRKVDQWIYYSIKEELLGIVEQLFQFLEKDSTLIDDQKTFETLYSNNILAIRKLDNKESKYQLPNL